MSYVVSYGTRRVVVACQIFDEPTGVDKGNPLVGDAEPVTKGYEEADSSSTAGVGARPVRLRLAEVGVGSEALGEAICKLEE